jgi:hypothetical protein
VLYIGHFSFVGNAGHLSNDPIHGSFTCLVEARSIDDAIQKLRELVKRPKRTWEGFRIGQARVFRQLRGGQTPAHPGRLGELRGKAGRAAAVRLGRPARCVRPGLRLVWLVKR